MKTSKTGRTVAAIAAAVMLAANLAWAAMGGVVTAVTTRNITVSGAVYELQKDTSIEDLTGEKIALSEIRPGVAVEIELDEEGRLVLIRAAVVR